MAGNEYDLAIAGCGSGGASAALRARRLGLSVIVVEPKPRLGVGDKVCGDAVPAYHFERLTRDAGIEPPSGSELGMSIRGMKLIGPSRQGLVRVAEGGYTIDRRAFGQRLADLVVASGATLMDRHLVLGAVEENGRVTGLKVRDRVTRMPRTVRARVVLDATGYAAALRRSVDFPGRERFIDQRDLGMCYREIRRLARPLDEPDMLDIVFDQSIARGGYFWVFPKSETVVNVGVGLSASTGQSPMAAFKRYIAQDARFAGSETLAKGGGVVPMRRPMASFVGDGLLLAGDAACQVNPLHGGGLGYSMVGGCMAAEAAAKAQEGNDPSRRAMWGYNHGYMTSVGGRHAALDVFRIMLSSLSNRELEFGVSGKLVTEQDLVSIDKGGELALPMAEKLRRALSGIAYPGLLLSLDLAVKRMKEMRTLYAAYPASPQGVEDWKAKLDAEYLPVWAKWAWAFEPEGGGRRKRGHRL